MAYAAIVEHMTTEERHVFDAKLEGATRMARQDAEPAPARPGVVDPYLLAPNNPQALMAAMHQVQVTTR